MIVSCAVDGCTAELMLIPDFFGDVSLEEQLEEIEEIQQEYEGWRCSDHLK